ncbi:O-antigen ligase family protein [Aureispira anguillae]|uniref:O-antigen ligase family protein n=1 Tax=Aureispira anguillae TaxID=2864201 RepID=A0A916DR46_9BACT|nr:O-antigen ligase family protein [Aureispira anguillae]BDS10001.1 O-antigen ligase family protein [Aureispira anguillae]
MTKRIWSLCLLLLPLIMINGLIDTVTIPRITLLLVGILLTVSLLLFKERQAFHIHSHKFITSPLGVSLIAYLLLGLFSLTNALSLSDGILEWLKLFCWFSTVLLTTFLLKEKGSSVLFMKATTVAALIVGGIGLFEFVSIVNQLDQDKILYVVNSTFEHKNLLATGLLLSVPLSFLLYANSTEKIWKGIAIGAIGLALFLILVTQSRAAWLGMGVGILVGVLLLLAKPSERKKIVSPKYLGMIGGCLILGGGLVWFLSSQEIIANAPVQRVQAIFTYEDTKNEHTETIKERLVLWENTIEMIKEHPLLGVGLGNWKIHFPKYSIDGLRSEQGQIFFQRPHNDYLWVMSELGLLGGLTYLFIIGIVLYYNLQLLLRKEVQGTEEYYSTLAITGGIIAFAVFSLVDFPKERPVHLLWTGILMAYSWHYHQLFIAKEKGDRISAANLVYFIPLIAAFGLFFMGQRWQAETHCKKALTARSQKQYHGVLTELALADHWSYRLDPAATPISWYKGEAFYFQRRLPEALEAFKQSNALHPYHLHTLNNLGATYFELNQLSDAQKYFKQVLEFAPHFPDVNMNMAAMSYNEGKTLEALTYLGNCIPGDYKEQRFLQFLTTICKRYAEDLLKIPALEPLHQLIRDFSTKQEWQITIHQQAQEYHRTLSEQIHLDLLFVAQEQQKISAEQTDYFTSILNNSSNH